MRVRAVFFDAGETLVHPEPSFPELFTSVLARTGIRRDPADVVEASRLVLHRFSEAAADQELWTTSPERSARFWKGVYERMLAALGLPDANGLPDTLYATFTDLDNYGLFEDVVPTLDKLAERALTLGIVSNFEAWLEDLLEALGVRNRFAVRAISGLEGVEKPDPRIFMAALDRAGLPPGAVAYVGDNPEFDVEPALRLGMFPVLIDRRERHRDHDGVRITDLRDLPDALESAA